MNRGGFIVRHREYLGDINASTAFTVQAYSINPGLSASFPWLSAIASAYEEYEFRGLIYEFKSLSSDAVLSSATSSALGYVAMATQYNAASSNFVSKIELENYEFANSNKPSVSFIHPVECKRRLNVDTHLYIRTGGVPTGQDQRLYDMGDFQIAVGGCQANTGVLGELWCTYEIELFHPKYIVGGNVETDHFFCTSCSNTDYIGTARTARTGSNLGCTLTSTTITFPQTVSDGRYYVAINWVGTVAAAATAPSIAVTNGQLVQGWGGGTSNTISAPQNGLAGQIDCARMWMIDISSAGCVLTLNGVATLPGGTLVADVIIAEVPSTLE